MSRNRTESNVLLISWIVTTLLLYFLVPKEKLRQAQVTFLFKQFITWLFGLYVVEKGYISYPYRLFKKANRTSFTFEYFVYPALCVFFNLYYPEKKNNYIKGLYYIFHTSFITILELILLKTTKLIRYNNWSWHWTFSTVMGSYFISRIYFRWFFKDSLGVSNNAKNHLPPV